MTLAKLVCICHVDRSFASLTQSTPPQGLVPSTDIRETLTQNEEGSELRAGLPSVRDCGHEANASLVWFLQWVIITLSSRDGLPTPQANLVHPDFGAFRGLRSEGEQRAGAGGRPPLLRWSAGSCPRVHVCSFMFAYGPEVERAAPCWRSGACHLVEADSSGGRERKRRENVQQAVLRLSCGEVTPRRGSKSPLRRVEACDASKSSRPADQPPIPTESCGSDRAYRLPGSASFAQAALVDLHTAQALLSREFSFGRARARRRQAAPDWQAETVVLQP